ncbi:MAG TPA: DoxX family protein [Terriglobales bacterium]|nr:DoxX family protein [Terriglobales bacterium]
MQSAAQTAPVSKGRLWAGRILSAIPALMLLFAGIMKLLKPPSMIQGLAQYGYPESLVVIIGILEMVCAVVYLIPRTSVLGAILATGFLGGAAATNVRVKDPSFVLPVVFGVLVWAGLFFRDERLRALIPLKN